MYEFWLTLVTWNWLSVVHSALELVQTGLSEDTCPFVEVEFEFGNAKLLLFKGFCVFHISFILWSFSKNRLIGENFENLSI